MKKDRKGLIITLSIIAAIVAILVIIAILFFTTDLLKSDQDRFFKYLGKNVEILNEYLKNPNSAIEDTIKQNKYITKSDINFDLVSSDTEIANQTVPPRNFTIQYVAQSDPQNNMDSSQATIKFLTKDLFTIKYAHNQNLYALTSDEVFRGGTYLAVDNNNLKELAKKFGQLDINNIPNTINPFKLTDLLNLSQEDIKYLQETYLEVINREISKEHYFQRKSETIQIDNNQIIANGYGISLNGEEYKNFKISFLNTVKQDEKSLNLLLEKIKLLNPQSNLTIDTLKTNIENQITQISNQISISGINGITICVYEKNGELVRTEIEYEDNKYIINYEKTGNSIRAIISYEFNNLTQNDNNNNTDIQNTLTNQIDDEYIQIEGTQNNNTIVNDEQTNKETNNAFAIKQIEIAKEIKDTTVKSIIIVTLEMGDNKTIKLLLQNNANQDEEGMNYNTVVNINDSGITYFTIKLNTSMKPSNDVVVEQLTNENSATINNFTPEYMANIINSVKIRLRQLYEEKMQIAKTVQQEENTSQGLTQVDQNAPEANTIMQDTNTI